MVNTAYVTPLLYQIIVLCGHDYNFPYQFDRIKQPSLKMGEQHTSQHYVISISFGLKKKQKIKENIKA